ncbi:MAG TPA: prepilin-type N-terminal cleavage/methylation domain-containing protein [Candidatus Methylacidiphilales bacterium]
MNALRRSLYSRRSGFTLVELTVAIAILVMVGLGLTQVLSLSLQTWQLGLIRADCYTKARVVLDAATADIQRGVFRPDLKNFPASTTTPPTFTFYTRAAGISTGAGAVRPVSLVTFQLSTASNLQGYLLRSEKTINWGTSGANLNVFEQAAQPVSAASAPASGPPNDLLSTGIVDLEIIFFLSDGTTVLAKNYQSPTAASVVMIGVATAVIDDKVLALLQPATSTRLSNIQTALERALSSNFSAMTSTTNPTTGATTYVSSNYGRSIKALWDPALAPFYTTTGYPKSIATGLQTFERFIPCTPFN